MSNFLYNKKKNNIRDNFIGGKSNVKKSINC